MAERRKTGDEESQRAEERREAQREAAKDAVSDKDSRGVASDRREDEGTVDIPRQEQGATYAEGTDGVLRLTSGPDDDDPDDDAPRVGPAPVVNAPQNWDDNTATFTAGAADPYAENVEAVNLAQSKATIAHQIKGESS